MVGSKALDEPTKMTQLIQFLEGPALLVVQQISAKCGQIEPFMIKA